MSSKKDPRKESERRVTIVRNGTSSFNNSHNLSSINDVTTDFDCLKISILNKAARVSGNFDKVTLGPHADHENDANNSNDIENSKTNTPPVNGSPASRSNVTFSIKKILLENEVQRRENVKKVVEKKKKEMDRSQKMLQEELSVLLARVIVQKEKEAAEKLARLEAEEEQLARLEIDKKNELERQRQKENEEMLKQVATYKENFHTQWKDIINASKSYKDKNSANRLLASYAETIKDLNSQLELINEKAKAGKLTPVDLKMAEIIEQSNNELVLSFKSDAEKIEAAYDEEIARRQLALEQAELQVQEEALRLKQMEEAAKLAQQASEQQIQNVQPVYQQVSEVDSGVPQPPQYPNTPKETVTITAVPAEVPTSEQPEEFSIYPDMESYQIFIASKCFLKSFSSTYSDFVKSDSMKKFKFECQKTLNITVNSISHVSREQLVDKYDKLRLFLSGKGQPNILLNPQAEAFSKNLLAQKILDQGDISISTKPELAFPFAAIVVALWNDWPDFGKILLTRFRNTSPFFVPVFLMPRNDQSEEDYHKSLGCKYSEDGTPETSDKFWKRLGGFMYLYASILVTRQRQGVNKPHPHGIANAWRWLAATVNMEPRSDIADICATLIYVMLEVTGNDLWKTYPTQFPKLLTIIKNVYYEKLKNFMPVESAPVSRLGEFLNNAFKQGTIPPPKGQLQPNFW